MKIFFSYAREDEAFALRLASDLREVGADVWIDQLDISPGQHWDSSVEQALKACPAFLVVLSPRSARSQNVMDEVHFAIEEAKKILPVMLEPCDLPFRLRRLQYIDFTRNYADGLQICTTHVTRIFASTEENRSRTSEQDVTRFVPRRDDRVRAENDRLDGIRILWVDDRPANNRYERQILEHHGAEVHLALDTADAMLIFSEIGFDLVISDMGRPSGHRAGYELLSQLRKSRSAVPFLIYAGSNSVKHRNEAKVAGASGSTNNPYELIELVLKCARSEM